MWIHEMLRYSKAAGLQSTYMALSFTWSRFDAKFRKDIPMPISATEVIDFLDQVDNTEHGVNKSMWKMTIPP